MVDAVPRGRARLPVTADDVSRVAASDTFIATYSRLLLLLTLSAGVQAGAVAQAPADTGTHQTAWRLGVFVGIGQHSPVNTLLGKTPGRQHLFVGLSAQRVILRAGALRISYAAQLIPLLLIHGDTMPPGTYLPGDSVSVGNVAYAFGFSPFGLRLELPLGRTVALYGATAAGGLIFDHQFPADQAGRLAITLEFGLGVSVTLPRDHWVDFGYKYHHLSNGNFALVNPGVDANVWYVGYQWAVHLTE